MSVKDWRPNAFEYRHRWCSLYWQNGEARAVYAHGDQCQHKDEHVPPKDALAAYDAGSSAGREGKPK